MNMERLTKAARDSLLVAHFEELRTALVHVFNVPEETSYHLVFSLEKRFEFAPQFERDLLLHSDVVALAADLCGRAIPEHNRQNLDQYNMYRKNKYDRK